MENVTIKLTEMEEKMTEGNDNILAQILIRKAIVKEMAIEGLNETEEKQLEKLKENLEVEYFLEKASSEGVQVNDIEIVKVYEENKDKFEDMEIEETVPVIKQAIINKKKSDNKIIYLNELIKKYNLNEKLKEYSENPNFNINKEVLNEDDSIREEDNLMKDNKQQ